MLYQSFMLCFLLFAVSATTSSIRKDQSGQRKARRAVTDVSLKGAGAFPPGTPSPQETIGDYFDSDPLQNSSQSTLAQRNPVKTKASLTCKWYDGHNHYNMSIQTCITFDTVAGMWTFQNGTTQDQATLLDISQDLRSSASAVARVLANANLAIAAAQAALKTAVCEYNPDNTHDDLRRKLLVHQDGHFAALMAKATLAGVFVTGFFAEALSNNTQSTGRNVAVGVVGLGLAFMFPTIDYLQARGHLTATEASIFAFFTSWYRASVQFMYSLAQRIPTSADLSGVGGCLPEGDVEIAVVGLGWASEGNYRNDGTSYEQRLDRCE